MNKLGGGIIHNNVSTSSEMKLFDGGLRNVRRFEWKNHHLSKNSPRDTHDAPSYERGMIIHARSPHNQHLNWHHSFGGFYNWAVKRYLINHFYRRVVRVAWFPVVVYFFAGWAAMRAYDNAVYDYFYFFDAKDGGHH